MILNQYNKKPQAKFDGYEMNEACVMCYENLSTPLLNHPIPIVQSDSRV